ncbi:MAG: RHS repeat-associated core domain-containing protein, partial [Bacteroidota bacterium]
YDYTRAGDVLSKYDSIRSLSYTYGYDALHRLTTESAIGPFSGFQDRTLNMYYESSAPHAVSRVNTGLGERTNIYDLNGNLTTGYDFKTPGLFPERRITYNAENMPLTIEYQPEGAPVVSVNYTYDGNGRRVKKQAGTDIVKYIDNVYELRNEQATKYVFAGNLRLAKIKGSNVQFYHKDHLGSSSVLSDENGVLTESVAYEPYGSQRKLFCAPESTDLNYTFTDQEWDAETGLYNYDARLYDSVLGRFITADNVIPNWHDPQTLDRYSYTRNNPLKYVDPDGHNFISLNDPTGAMDYGHNASLVGNNDVGWHYFSKDKNGIKNQTHSYFTTFENFLKSPLSQRYATGYDVETTPDQDEQMINKGFEIYKNEYDIHKNNCADLNAEIGDKGGVKIAKPKDKSPLLSKNFTGPNLQQEKLRKNEPKGNERNLIQERKEIRRKLYDKIRERKRSK